MTSANNNHGYSLAALHQACEDEDIDFVMQEELSQKNRDERQHTSLKSPHPKKLKKVIAQEEEISSSVSHSECYSQPNI